MNSTRQQREAERFRFLVTNIAGWLDSGPAIAAARCGATGILNLEGITDSATALRALARAQRLARGPIGVKIEAGSSLASDLLDASVECVILTGAGESAFSELAKSLSARGHSVYLEVTSIEHASSAANLPLAGLIAKGHEAGGAVGEETAFVLLQRLLALFPNIPVFVHGGIGLHSVAACYVAGAAGVVLDNQVLLAAESSLPTKARAFVERSEGDDTICVGLEAGWFYRLCKRPGMNAAEQLLRLEQELIQTESPEKRTTVWADAIRAKVGWTQPENDVWPLGQDTVFAAPLAKRYRTVSGIVRAFRESLSRHVEQAKANPALSPRSSLAQAHRTEFPILQGPMTRVSDTSQFAASVAENGGLPFLALALLRAPQVRKLLAETKELVNRRSWGVGILGFVPADLRAEQLQVVREFLPPFAIIAGGRPDQAASLEKDGISTYLHVPAPSLLRMFVQDGARGFIFEGRECGGHVGPRTSFVLWDSMIEVLLEEIEKGVPASELRIVFAGGIHDARSAAMVEAMAAPLSKLGVKIGVLLGTAYLFTEEAVSAGAIVSEFQQEALQCRKTVLLESGPGHATRCVETPFFEAFRGQKRRLIAEGKSTGEIRDALEDLNIGRLRIASKGITRVENGSGAQYEQVPLEIQRRDGMYMIGQIAALRKDTCTVRELHEAVSPGSTEFLKNVVVPVSERRTVEAPPPCDVAIVGMSCLLPKATDVRTLWTNIVNKVDAIQEVPANRFHVDIYFDKDRNARDKIYSRWGGFLDDEPFDPLRYGIPPNALSSIDPMQLLSLIVVDRALGDAGYRDREFSRDRTSVIFGMSGGLGDQGINYAVRSTLAQYIDNPPEELLSRLPEWTEDSFAGILMNVTTGRVANRFDFGGVNFTVDAACASSLAAVYVAAQELTSQTSDLVIVGGVDTVQSPFGYLCFSKSQALSPGGACRTFDAGADGIAISEGISILVLKRLEDAERDGDRIYSVIKGVAGSSDGRGRSMTAPRVEGQVVALQRAFAQARIRPSTVSLIEAHGTGTAAGDAAELAALSKVFGEDGAAPHSCSVGSIKSMIGHTKSAAGVTGLMKAALSLYHRTLPPTLHVDQPNPKLREAGTAFYVNTEPHPWIARSENGEEVPRRAGVSSFGFGGTNFHAVLEEYRDDIVGRSDFRRWPEELFLWSASSQQVLADNLSSFLRDLDKRKATPFADLAAEVNARTAPAQEGQMRLAAVASSIEDLKTKIQPVLDALRAGREKTGDSKSVYLERFQAKRKLALLFPGQGSQKPGMLRELALVFPEFRDTVAEADRTLNGRFREKKLSSYIYPPPAFGQDEERQQMRAVTETDVAQPALGAVEAALTRLLRRLGIGADMTAGHSYGEYVALYAAGAFDEETLFRLSEERGRTIKESLNGDSGTMAAVAADACAVRQALNSDSGVVLANLNSPRQTVISGPTEAIQSALRTLENAKLAAKLIPVACAFHSPLMQPARNRLAEALEKERFAELNTVAFSNANAQPYPQEPAAIRVLLAGHLVQPVRFVEEIEAMYQAGARIFLETGPKGVLTALAQQILEGKDALFLKVDDDRNGLKHFLEVLGCLFANGVDLNASELSRGRTGEILPQQEQTGWLVNGGGSFARGHRPEPKPPLKLTDAVVPVTPAAPAPPLPTLPVSGTPETADAVMTQFQRLMGQFLETQAAVMNSYLGGAPVSFPAPVPVAAPSIAPVLPPPVVAAAPSPVVAPKFVAPKFQRDYAAEIKRIASERTGYPADMLDLDAAIEADLGIDSIKRVEILSTFQRLCTADEQAKVQAVMETLTKANTLREIADRITAALPATVESKTQPQAVPPAAQRDYAAELKKIASDRTGYPADMLDLDAAIEADLGIDSIKRVEILSSFQRLCSAEEQAKVQTVMETLTKAGTLREIANRIIAALPATTESKTPPQVVAQTAKRDYAAELKKIASDRTGYPADMLDLDAAIEADLGIDSIKRVEILSSFQRLCSTPEQASVQAIMETLTASRTLREIANRISAVLDKALPPAASEADVPRCVLGTADIPRHAEKPRYFPGRVCVITDDEHGIASGVAERLAGAGEVPILLRHSPDAPLQSADVFGIDLTNPEAISSLVETIQQQRGPVGAIIHLLPLRTPGQIVNLEEWHRLLALDVKCLYALARAAEPGLKQTGRAKGAMLAAVTARGGEFGLRPDDSISPSHHAVADFVKTVALEFPEVACKVVDLDPSDPVAILRQKLVDELCPADGTLQVGLPGDRRLTVVPQLASISDSANTVEPDWVCLLTGGARGITAEIAKALARKSKPTLILVGSSPLPSGEEPQDTAGIEEPAHLKAALMNRLRTSTGAAVKPAEVEAAYQRLTKNRQILQTMEKLAALGSRVEYHAVDVRNEAAFGSLIDDIYARHRRLDLVVHGAGIIEDKLLRDKTPASFDKVLLTKADSAFILSRKLRPESLRCLLFMSSISAMFGNRGQADYAAANGVYNGMALALATKWPGRAVAMNWGPWDQAGMVSDETREQFLSRGVQVIPPGGGANAALQEIGAGNRDEVLVGLGGGPWLDGAREASVSSVKNRAEQVVGSAG